MAWPVRCARRPRRMHPWFQRNRHFDAKTESKRIAVAPHRTLAQCMAAPAKRKRGIFMKALGWILAILAAGVMSVLLVQRIVRKLYTDVGKRYVDVEQQEQTVN